MSADIIGKTEALRSEAWEAVKSSPAFAAFKALDEAVAAMGGKSMIATPDTRASVPSPAPRIRPRVAPTEHSGAADTPRRMSQGDAAEAILREIGEPMSGIQLLELLPEKGVTVGGERPVPNFTSNLSRDDRFRTFRKDGIYYWRLKEWPEPNNSEAGSDAFDDLLNPASSSTHQEGGEAYATTS